MAINKTNLNCIADTLLKLPESLDNNDQLKGLLFDSFPEKRSFVNQAVQAYAIVIAGELKKGTLMDCRPDQLVKRFQVESEYDSLTAKHIIDAWLSWLTPEVLAAYHSYKRESIANSKEESQSPAWRQHDEKNRKEYSIRAGDILIPCKMSNSGSRFLIRGIDQTRPCINKKESVFAVLYNYLQRSSLVAEKHYLLFDKKGDPDVDAKPLFDYIFQLMVTLLAMVRFGYDDGFGRLRFHYDGNPIELQWAEDLANEYLKLFYEIAKRQGAVDSAPQISHWDDSRCILGFHDKANISILDAEENPEQNTDYQPRALWFAPKIEYQLGDHTKDNLVILLREISKDEYQEFNPGQYESLVQMVNTRDNSICIMPTGSGKSLIFYLMAILQPAVTLVIAPTEILITDQIRNLKETHSFDSAKRIKAPFECYPLDTHLGFATPEVFQQDALLKETFLWNKYRKLAAVVLDEVHCLSSWSHDFRPEYLMLSRRLNSFLDHSYLKGYTATANYTVIKEICDQLMIREEHVFSPVELKKKNYTYKFTECENEEEMIRGVSDCLRRELSAGHRTLVFVKSENRAHALSEGMAEDIKEEAPVFTKGSDEEIYKGFADGYFKALITTDELGVGINLKNVRSIIHFGLPISKGEYVQQIGRAGREGSKANSFVFYLDPEAEGVDPTMVKRDGSMDSIAEIIRGGNNDYTVTYERIFGDAGDPEQFRTMLHKTYDQVKDIKDVERFCFEDHDKAVLLRKRCLYALLCIGVLNAWNIVDDNTVVVQVNRENLAGFSKLRQNYREYLQRTGNDKKRVFELSKLQCNKELLDHYISWYYGFAIYYHKEQLLDMLSMVLMARNISKDMSNGAVTNMLAAYFNLRIASVTGENNNVSDLSYVEIAEDVLDGEYGENEIADTEQANQSDYNIKLDWKVFCYRLVINGWFDEPRFDRIYRKIVQEDVVDFTRGLSRVYARMSDEQRLKAVNTLWIASDVFVISFEYLFDLIYRDNREDLVYYGYCSKLLNSVFNKLWRNKTQSMAKQD